MKTLCLAVVVGGLALSPALQAQQSDDTVRVPVPANQARIELPAAYYKMWPEDYRDLVARYSLSNGQTLSIVARGMSMYAFVDQDRPHKIVNVSRNTYVALDRQLKLEIDRQDENEVHGWLTMVVPPHNLADGSFIPERTVQLALR
ncbi:hypothetical protein RugamoR64_07090 [Duganella rhizosphaerae]|uniref:hypothetical protein n=1 Tax=Duganella rhizosphaerae TaxID=2885763 RepID=UPI0030E886F5